MKKLLFVTCLFILSAGIALGVTIWSDYADQTAGNVQDVDTFLMRDVSDTTLHAKGTQKEYPWSVLKTDLASAGFMEDSDYDAQTILRATTDDTPVALTVTEQTVIGRATGGNIAALAIDSDISAVSANDDTVPSAKASKAANDALVSAVLDCASGDCDELVDASFAFTDGDTTPDISNGSSFITANSGATTITDFDTEKTNGKIIFVTANDANTTLDFTASGLVGIANDYLMANGELAIFQYSAVSTKWHYNGFPKTLTSVTISGFTANRPLISNNSGEVIVDDNSGDIEVSGSSKLVIKANAVEYSETSGSSKALTPITDSTADFAANFTGANLYGGTFVANADDGDLQLPAMLVNMNFCVITLGAIEVVADTNAADGYLMDGTTGVEGANITNLSAAGDIACFQYYTADDWLITTNGWTAE